MTDERLWELWRQAQEDHTVEVDLAFGRLVAEEAVKQEREACAKLCESYEGTISECMGDIEGILGAKIRARGK